MEALLGLRKVVRLVRLVRLMSLVRKRPRWVYAKALDLAEDAGGVHEASRSGYRECRAYTTDQGWTRRRSQNEDCDTRPVVGRSTEGEGDRRQCQCQMGCRCQYTIDLTLVQISACSGSRVRDGAGHWAWPCSWSGIATQLRHHHWLQSCQASGLLQLFAAAADASMSRIMSRTENTLRIGCTQVYVPCDAEGSSSLVSLVAVCRLRRLWNLGQTTKEPGSQHKQGTSGLCTDLRCRLFLPSPPWL